LIPRSKRSKIVFIVKLQLSLFKKKEIPTMVQFPSVEPVAPTGKGSVMQSLPAYSAYLYSKQYSESTIEKYLGDVKKFSVVMSHKKLEEITEHDVEQWIETLVSKKGESLDRKTVNRKVSAIINYFSWLMQLGVLAENPTDTIANARIQSPLPDYLYESEIKTLLATASADVRLYLLVLLFLDTGIKSNELFSLTKANIDISDAFAPEIWIKHKGKARKKALKKDRKVALSPQFTQVYTKYLEEYPVEDKLFPYTDRFIQLLFADLRKRAGIEKELTPKTLRHTHVVRALKRGEEKDKIFDRIGLAPDSRKEAYEEVYAVLAERG
jgi:site-specific recombinase XerD